MASSLTVGEHAPSSESEQPTGVEGDAKSPFLATPELDRAMVRFVSEAVDARMAEDPILGKLRRLPLPEGVVGVSVEVDQTSLDSPSIALSHGASVMTDDLIQGNFEELHRIVLDMAESFLGQYLPGFFQHIETAVESVGNSLDLSGEDLSWDRILDAYERVEWAPDDSGIVRPPQIYAGPEVSAKIDALPDWTPTQQARFVDMWITKQEGHVSRRRSRELRHESDGA